MSKAEKVYNYLKAHNIEFKRFEHPPVFTVEDILRYNLNLPGTGCKNLFLKDNNGKKHFLVVVPDEKRVDLRALCDQNDFGRLGFASEGRLLKYLDLTPGSVSPFGLINDTQGHVIVIVDQDLMKTEEVTFHPNINTETLLIKTTDFKLFLDSLNNKKYYIQIPEM